MKKPALTGRFFFALFMALSEVDSKKCQTILNSKQLSDLKVSFEPIVSCHSAKAIRKWTVLAIGSKVAPIVLSAELYS